MLSLPSLNLPVYQVMIDEHLTQAGLSGWTMAAVHQSNPTIVPNHFIAMSQFTPQHYACQLLNKRADFN